MMRITSSNHCGYGENRRGMAGRETSLRGERIAICLEPSVPEGPIWGETQRPRPSEGGTQPEVRDLRAHPRLGRK